jgi:Spy/CpxP family protein refolding chaperone
MRNVGRAALLAALLASVPARAQMEKGPGMMMGGGPGFGPPTFLAKVFPPKLVMEHQQELGLRPAQIDAIKQAMKETQQKLTDLQWRLDAESEALGKLLSADHVDEAAVLAKLDQVTAIEQQVKKVNFGLLVRIKNQLDPEQQAKLRELRPARHGFGGAGPGGPGGGPPPPP